MKELEKSLEKLPLYRLREIGREKGVKSPTTVSKAQLIKEICDIEEGRILPQFSTRGRPSIKFDGREPNGEITFSMDKMLRIERIITYCKNQIMEILLEE